MSTRLVKGNTAVVVGALYAGCECFFGYPITPASEIAHDAALYFPRAGRQFLQAESEIAAINMLYGASSTGKRAMTGSSGPGVSLMMEGVSYLAGAELPAVVVDIMRAGPGLGNIGPEQGDYNQIVKGGGHGNYKNIVLAPESVQEMCDYTMKAFDLALQYRTPVFVLADAVLGQMMEPLRFPQESVTPKETPEWALAADANFRQNVVTSIYLDFDELEELNVRLQQKYSVIEQNECRAETFQADDADLIVVAYGICSRIARTAVEKVRENNQKVGLLRPQTLYPFPKKSIKQLQDAKPRRYLVVEMSNGQLIDDVNLALGCSAPIDLVSRMGGRLLTLEEVDAGIQKMLA